MKNNQSGQLVIEAVLLMAFLLGISYAVTSFLQQNKVAQKLTSEPWGKLAGMIECGTWQVCQGTPGLHPSTRDRNLSLEAPRGN